MSKYSVGLGLSHTGLKTIFWSRTCYIQIVNKAMIKKVKCYVSVFVALFCGSYRDHRSEVYERQVYLVVKAFTLAAIIYIASSQYEFSDVFQDFFLL